MTHRYSFVVKEYRHDVQGLRALAVLLVIANHVLGWPGGGFVGVDVFFVISGFLITGLLLREHERTGTISFRAFYDRRVRRILPAALTVLVVTVVAGYTVLPKVRFESLAWDAVWAALFSSNWRSIFLGTDYMHVDDAPSPLQHFWSLSIEEQFYFVWPVILILALTYGFGRPRKTAGIVIAVVGLSSLGYAIWETSTNPTSAYFSTFSRVWELAAGAFLALAGSRLRSVGSRWRPALAWVGLVAIAGSALMMTGDTPFPGPWAIVPVLGALAVLAAGTGGDQRYLWPLTNPVTGYIGNLSYSLYLWHFPVLMFGAIFIADSPGALWAFVIVTTFVLAMISYHFIENPVRFRTGNAWFLRPMAAVLVIAVAAVVSVSTAARPSPPEAEVAAEVAPALMRNGVGPASQEMWKQIDDALAATSWPAELDPAIDNVRTEDKASEWVVDGCLGDNGRAEADAAQNALRCVYGDPKADKVAVVYGDSTAIGWVPGVRAALEPRGYRVEVLAFQQCPTADIATNYSTGSGMPECEVFRDWAVSHIEQLHPDLVIATNIPTTLQRLASGATGEVAQAEWEEASRLAMEKLSDMADEVVVLQAPPTRNNSDACALRGSVPADCELGRSALYVAMFTADSAASTNAGVRFVDTGPWFCAADGRCPAFVESAPVLVDGAHLTENRSLALAPVLAEVLVGG